MKFNKIISIILAISTLSFIPTFLYPISFLDSGFEMAWDKDYSDSNIFIVPIRIPPLDLRGYDLNFSKMQDWFFDRINYHRENYGIHSYSFYAPAIITSIEHSLDMRDNNFSSNISSDGRTHQQRHDRWFGINRTRVTSSHVSSHWIPNSEMNREIAYDIIDRIMENETTHNFIMNPTYYYIGIGFSIQENGRGRLNIIMASNEGERAAHLARTPAEREAHRIEYLERIRIERLN